MRNLPDEIYLQVQDYDDPEPDGSTNFDLLQEVSWCKERVNDSDIRYFRAPEDTYHLAIPKTDMINGIVSFCQRYMTNEAKLHLIEYLKSRTEPQKP